MSRYCRRSPTLEEIMNNARQQFNSMDSVWLIAKQAQRESIAPLCGVGLATFWRYYLLKYKSHMWTNTDGHPGSWNLCVWYCKHNLILIYKSLQFDPEDIMIMSSFQIIPAWMNLPFSQASHLFLPWRWGCGLSAATSFLGSCSCLFQFDFWLGLSHGILCGFVIRGLIFIDLVNREPTWY